jgi:hypothetical protein
MSSASIGPVGPPPPEVVVRIVQEESRRTMTALLATVQKSWLELAAPSRRTGTYMRSIHPVITRSGAGWAGEVVAEAPHATWLEEGTGIYGPRRHPIVPTDAAMLRYPDRGGGKFTLSGRQRAGRRGAGAKYIFARTVRGQEAKHYGRDAVLKAQGQVDAELEIGAERIAVRLAAATRAR